VAVTPADLEQMKTTLGALESKIANLEEVLSKLSVTQEPAETDFGISGKGKTAGGGEPIRDRAADLVKKMGGFSNNY
jgi:phage shock protein A